mmetsp:Transcript_16812/g.29538  ORF Transcript_16812/g.29538 Transcript_16812/m.29538 type:complete len:713 (+) Transcript_16812:113-2251(+)|eukprot:CAMPEP_0197641912 /NCGR_PEP_ID=MMETSP1338-20131121/15720_1 /TAXON_ID=43686 ORGANISM="Pelagodinium beii, Strain RCC1491" /NCGR_SAMPLE_ID=MMETSP1338 /ASSEMBLY_ACC=CAM_ASM_000754 /LENGTH=712 /DNA_ID=CAMNT_0043214957 /DNA_START=46 /DNA_END=2184 /DNA_ORIENTATION=+
MQVQMNSPLQSPRRRNADLGLSSAAIQHNESSARRLSKFKRLGLELTKERTIGWQDANVAVELQRFKAGLEEVGSQAQEVLHRHQEFLSAGQSGGSSDKAKDANNNTSERPHTSEIREDEDELDDNPGNNKVLSRAQTKACTQFDSIDSGKVDQAQVFAKIGQTPQRVETKLDFFRDRPELVLPQIEDRFMSIDKKSGSISVDLQRLQSLARQPLSAREPRKMRLRILSDEDSDKNVEEGGLVMRQVQSVETLPGTSRKSPFCSQLSLAESLEQRSLRMVAAAQTRDRRIAAAQKSVRSTGMEVRLLHLERLNSKADRKALAERHRILLTWVVTAISIKAFGSSVLWLRKQLSKGPPETQKKPEKNTQLWMKAKGQIFKDLGMNLDANRLQMALQKRWALEDKARKGAQAFASWKFALRAIHFIYRLKLRLKKQVHAEAIKQFIEASWKGMNIRKAIRSFLVNTRMLQRAFRAAIALSDYTRRYVYHPALWEMETQILGDKLKTMLPHGLIKTRLAMHKSAWDAESRKNHVRSLVEARNIKGCKARQLHAPIEKKRPKSGLKKRRGALRQDRWKAEAVFSEHGEAVLPSFVSKKVHPSVEAAIQVVDSYRIDPDARASICASMFRRAVDAWWESHLVYKSDSNQSRLAWKQWFIEVQALGKTRRDDWPVNPPVTEPPSLLLSIDTQYLQSMLKDQLSQTQNGKNLFAKSTRG